MNEVLQKMKERRSIRKLKPDMVAQEQIEQIVEAGVYAASGRNLQAGIVVAVTDKEIRDRLSKANAAVMGVDSDPFYGAPVVLVVLADKSCRTYVYDGSLMMERTGPMFRHCSTIRRTAAMCHYCSTTPSPPCTSRSS